METLYVFAEHTARAGSLVPDRLIEAYLLENPGMEACDCDDWFVVDGTREELIEDAHEELAEARSAFARRVARTVLNHFDVG